MANELDFWLGLRKDLECAMIRKYLYTKKEGNIIYSRGHNNKLLPPSVWMLCSSNNMRELGYYSVAYQQKAFSKYSKRIHDERSGRRKIEEEIATILNSKELTFRIVSYVREEGVEEAYKWFKRGKQNTPSKKTLNRLKNLCNQFSEISGEFHYKITKNEKSIIKRWIKKEAK